MFPIRAITRKRQKLQGARNPAAHLQPRHHTARDRQLEHATAMPHATANSSTREHTDLIHHRGARAARRAPLKPNSTSAFRHRTAPLRSSPEESASHTQFHVGLPTWKHCRGGTRGDRTSAFRHGRQNVGLPTWKHCRGGTRGDRTSPSRLASLSETGPR
jgi:hypothetical protein